jgi:Transglycosylase SLT domain
MPETAANVGLNNPFYPLQAIAASARLLRDLVRQFGNVGLAAAAYNAGPRRIQDWLARKGKLPDETQHFVKTTTGRPAETWTSGVAAHPPLPLPRHAPCRDAAVQVASNSRSTGRAMIAARAHVQLARFRAGKTPTVVMAQRASPKPAGEPGKKPATASAQHVVNQNKDAIQLAAASKKKHRKLQLLQRRVPCGTFSSQINSLPKTAFMETGNDH